MFASTSDDPSIDSSGQTYDGFELDDVFRAPSGADGMFISFEPVSRSQQGEPKGLPSWTTLGLQQTGPATVLGKGAPDERV